MKYIKRALIKKWVKTLIQPTYFFGIMGLMLTLLAGCEKKQSIISNVDEKEANVILVLLESKGIPSMKMKSSSSGEIGGGSGSAKYTIMVDASRSIDAIAFLNQNGFPRVQGSSLLDLFAKQGLMTSDKEETIRYQAGLSQQITNMILKMDGIIDASVQLSFPSQDAAMNAPEEKVVTAAVYVKHQGVVDDPNIHLENKIKRLVSASVSGLDINDVTVVSDRSRFTDISLHQTPESLTSRPNDYVSIWSIVMSKQSASRFRFLFFLITFLAVIFAVVAGWFIWKHYPALKRKGGLKDLMHPAPIEPKQPPQKSQPPEGNRT